MRIGPLDHKITIQRLSAASPQQTAEGEPDESWTDYLTDISAEWATLSGNALFAAQQQHAEVRGVWRIRWRDGITAKMRVVHNGLYYNILFVPPFDKQGRNWLMELQCSQGVSLG